MSGKRNIDLNLKEVDKRSADAKKIKKIFLEAFPPAERPPYLLLEKLAVHSFVDFYGAYDRDKLIGFVYVVRHCDLAYVFFLALSKDKRGQGYGRKMMAILVDKYKDSRLFLALEELDKNAKNYAQRLARHRFYESCGLKDMPYRIDFPCLAVGDHAPELIAGLDTCAADSVISVHACGSILNKWTRYCDKRYNKFITRTEVIHI